LNQEVYEYMGRIGIYLEDDLEKRLKEYAFKTSGNFRSQSDIVAKAVKEYLDNHEQEMDKQGNFEGVPVSILA